MFKAVIQLNSNFIVVPVGGYWSEYARGISGKRFRAPNFDPCLNYLIQESLFSCHVGRSVSQIRHLMVGREIRSPSQVSPPLTCCQELLSVCEQSLELGPPGETVSCNRWLLNKSTHVGRDLS